MKEKYRGTENFVKERTPPKEKNLKVESKDKSSSSKELEKIYSVSKTKEKNMNGKVGINKHNNYAPDMYETRKVCAKCGSTNHMSIICKIVSTPIPPPTVTPSQPLMPNLAALSTQFSFMPFMNPFLAYNMNFVMPWNMNNDYSLYASKFANAMNSDLSKIEPVNVPMTQIQTPKIETELISSKLVVANSGKKSKGGTNKAGPKTVWVPKIT